MFYALRYIGNDKLFVQQHQGVGIYYVPTASTPDDVQYLQHLLTFKSHEECNKFVTSHRRKFETPDGQPISILEMVFVKMEIKAESLRDIAPKETKEKVYRRHVVTDQGNGGAYCSKCGHDLTSRSWFGEKEDPPIYPCPGCGAEWEDTDVSGYGFGGSDF